MSTEPLVEPKENIGFADVISGEFDAEAEREHAAPAKRVLLPQPESPKLHKVLAQSGLGSRLDMEAFIRDGIAPPWVEQKGAPHINTYLVFVPTISVPAGWTRENMPTGLTFVGRPYDDARLISYAYAFFTI